MQILAIDPGNIESAFVRITAHDRAPIEASKVQNAGLLAVLTDRITRGMVDEVAIEMVASYGMPVGAEVFDTCVWIGRYAQHTARYGIPVRLIKRPDIKLHHTGHRAAKDANVTRALVERFTPGQPNYGKGTKAEPGFFYGFHRDIWQAYACGVYAADHIEGNTP